jgi:hypothetical protein
LVLSGSLLLGFVDSVHNSHVLFFLLNFGYRYVVIISCVANVGSSTRTGSLSECNDSDVPHFELLGNDFLINCLVVAIDLVFSLQFLTDNVLEFTVQLIHSLFWVLNRSFVLHVWTINEVIPFANFPIVF